jgi:glycosyltransferase involved in cell wall biosynthesis
MSACAVIPVYNHSRAIGAVVAGVRRHGLPCILVDDGSEVPCAAVLDAIAASDPAGVRILRLPQNSGKGAAVTAGLREALRDGYSHALQIDADGQHDSNDIPGFLDASRAHPDALICGASLFDETVPKSRLIARYATHVWVWINTLSLDIRDSMCGFRIYPLTSTVSLLDSVHLGSRMDFDTEVLVRLHWRGVRIVNRPTPVRYPADGVSHFRLWDDNVRISWMHTRLFVGMLVRLPLLLWRKVQP